VLTAAWIFAAIRLWRTNVPSDLALPHLDPHRFFSYAKLDRAASYEEFLRIDALLASLAAVAATGVFALVGPRFVRESAAGRIGTGMLLGMLGLAFIWLAELPFGLAALWWERKHDVSTLDYLSWIVNDFLSAGGQFLFISLALLIVMALAGVWRRAWWVVAVPALLTVALLFAFVQPYLLPSLHPLRDPALAADARQLAADEGVANAPVRVQDTHNLGGAPNAEAAGVDGSRRVIIWDTLLRRFPASEVRVVLAHEFGHLAHDDVLRQLAWTGLLAVPIALAVAFVTRRRGGIYEPTAVPLALFVVVALLWATLPVRNAYSRRLEANADWSALQATHDPAAAKALFRRFTRVALIQPTSPGWATLLLENHPTIMKRIELAEAWRSLHPTAR
jgi:Zn-dependent protease with chaperone function